MGQSDKNADKRALNALGELSVSFNNTRKSIEVTNNRAKYYSDLASQYKDEARELMELAKFYAEQNSDVTMSNIKDLEVSLLAQIAQKQEVGDYALKSEIPVDNNQLTNGAGYITSSYHDNTKQDVIADLTAIREGSAKGAAALQAVPEEYITESELDELFQYKMVDSYVNGTSGYNVWKTPLGYYCEQWGYVSASSTVSLLKRFANVDYYNVTASIIYNSYTNWSVGVNKIDKSTFYLNLNTGSSGVMWRASGYLAEGEY